MSNCDCGTSKEVYIKDSTGKSYPSHVDADGNLHVTIPGVRISAAENNALVSACDAGLYVPAKRVDISSRPYGTFEHLWSTVASPTSFVLMEVAVPIFCLEGPQTLFKTYIDMGGIRVATSHDVVLSLAYRMAPTDNWETLSQITARQGSVFSGVHGVVSGLKTCPVGGECGSVSSEQDLLVTYRLSVLYSDGSGSIANSHVRLFTERFSV